MAKRSGFQTTAQLEAERAAARIANLSMYSDRELVEHAIRFESNLGTGGHSYAQDGANHYRNEIARRRAAALVAA